ncbi:MAG: serine/threonine protein kinase [Labilithrix sp.]|nr:serine/threonine protein kinase [Labilithrix sp.]
MLRRSVVEEEPLASPVSPGEIVAGKYCVEGVLGVGGMGVVVRARHTALDQIVAIKLLVKNKYGSYEEAVARFLAEARAAARIESDHVCRVFDVGTLPNGVPFLVMEHLEGRDLDDEVQARGPLPLVEAVDYVMQAADALAAAHQLGIVHRDIKPANLFLAVRPDGSRRVKILDFGISKAGPEGAGFGGGHRKTDAATSLGTPAYMSPEQVRAAPDVDARTDIWGLGAILYELVTGEMAFVGDDVKAVLDMVLAEDPCPMTALRRDVPPELESIVMRCLERDRDRRWTTAATFARALAPFGSMGMFSLLASVQRELGSHASMRTSAAPSVEPMSVSMRGTMPTQPDPSEVRARVNIVEDWTQLRARRRTARVAVTALAAVTFVVAAAAALLWLGGSRRGAEASAAAAPPEPVEVASAPPVIPAAIPPEPTVIAAPSASVYPASTSVQTARVAPARAPAKAGAASRGAGPRPPQAGSGSVNHLLDTRD